jgi:predicted CXXCH cytochrome family protein
MTWMRRSLYLVLSAAPLGFYGLRHQQGRDAVFLPGRTSDGHHQIERKCTACHTPGAGVSSQACWRCHGESLRARDDSHAPYKFDDPGRAGQLEIVDARSCVPCHREHRPEARARGSVSLAATFCTGCHAEIGRERPSHRGFTAEGCASAGCHNYHDNRALYRDFLTKHRAEPALRPIALVPVPGPPRASPAVADAPGTLQGEGNLLAATMEWNGSGHARGGVSCTGCHQPDAGGGPAAWAWKVEDGVCERCHGKEREGFLLGKHGMRLAAGLTAMQPAAARAPMKPEAHDRRLGCTSCHGAHRFDRARAALEACEGCHDDRHTRDYRGSGHFLAWQRERRGEAPPGSGVSCATCHLPRVALSERISVQHNQNGNLRPSDRMVREVCGHCHGVGYALSALADPAVARSFRGKPSPVVATGMKLIEGGDSEKRN